MPNAIFSNNPLHAFSQYTILQANSHSKFQSSLLLTLLLGKILWKIDYISMIKRHGVFLYTGVGLLRRTNFTSIRICWFCAVMAKKTSFSQNFEPC